MGHGPTRENTQSGMCSPNVKYCSRDHISPVGIYLLLTKNIILILEDVLKYLY